MTLGSSMEPVSSDIWRTSEHPDIWSASIWSMNDPRNPVSRCPGGVGRSSSDVSAVAGASSLLILLACEVASRHQCLGRPFPRWILHPNCLLSSVQNTIPICTYISPASCKGRESLQTPDPIVGQTPVALPLGSLELRSLGAHARFVKLQPLSQMLFQFVVFSKWTVFSRVHATLQPTLSVGPSVRRSVGNALVFLSLYARLSHSKSF